ncbi:molybdopterin-containing oxidoreductase family protein [Microbaculum marinum]|uniref:Molybdopterin-dependent oxidoreductase n=1 Tax=Microbaculum marinum TaxID=1764581 RepID=A0AAW9RRV3_9HYPH
MNDVTRTPAYCAQCRSRCGCNAVIENGRILAIEPLPGHPSGEKLCPKGKATPELVYHPDRLTTPLRRTSPKGAGRTTWEPISWDEALATIAERMAGIRDRHGPEQVAFSVTTPSGTQISDGIAWVERFIRGFGSPNMIYSTEICNWHKDVASKFTYGWDIGTPDFAESELIVLWGHNPTATWLARSVEVQKAMKRGARLLVVDPRPTLYARRADCWLRVRPGTDQVLALGLANLLIGDGGIDADFVREWTNGPMLVRSDTGAFLRQSDISAGGSPDVLLAAGPGGTPLRYDAAARRWLDDPGTVELDAAYIANVGARDVACRSAFGVFADTASAWTPERVEAITGVPTEALRAAAALLAQSKATSYYAWNGVGQSTTASQTDRAISILYSLTGCYGRKGGNVPGVAAPFADISGHDLLTDEQRAKAVGLDERPLGPGRTGWVTGRDVYRAILDGEPYPVRMLFSFGTNLLVSQPDTDRAREAFERLEFHVHTDFFLNPSAEYADIVLPVSTSWEREGLRTGFDASLQGLRRVQLRPAVIEPVGEARSDTDIVIDLALRLGMSETFFGGDADRGHDHALAPAGLTVEQLRASPEGIDLPGSVPYRPYARADGAGVPAGFPTPTGRLEIYSERLLEHGYAPVPEVSGDAADPDPDFPLTVSCAKVVAFCHSQHRNLASLRRLMPDPMLEMSAESAAERGIADNDWVKVATRTGSFVARCRIVRDLEPAIVFAQHGWWFPEADQANGGTAGPRAANMNQAVDTSRSDPISGSIPLRATPCQVERMDAPAS